MHHTPPTTRRAALDLERKQARTRSIRERSRTPAPAPRPPRGRNRLPSRPRSLHAGLVARSMAAARPGTARSSSCNAPRLAATVMLIIGLVLGQGLPADAVGSASTAADITLAPGAPLDQSQNLIVGDTVARPFDRDSFSVRDAPRLTPARSGSSAAVTFPGAADSPVRWPFTASPISSGFGPRAAPCRGCSSNHLGLDFTPGGGTPVAAVADGVVRTSTYSSGWGMHVIVDHEIDGRRVSTLYAHMQNGSVALSKGDRVTVGQDIGRVGNTGLSTGAHLHLETWLDDTPVDPAAWLTATVQ